MALDFSKIEVVLGSGMSKRKSNRVAGPNPFIDNGWLESSHELGQDHELQVSGSYVDSVHDRGVLKGQAYSKLTGDAAEAVNLIRQGATKLGLGVSVEVVPALRKNGQPIAGQLVVKYQAKDKRARRTKPRDE
jgi:hypothetical protein